MQETSANFMSTLKSSSHKKFPSIIYHTKITCKTWNFCPTKIHFKQFVKVFSGEETCYTVTSTIIKVCLRKVTHNSWPYILSNAMEDTAMAFSFGPSLGFPLLAVQVGGVSTQQAVTIWVKFWLIITRTTHDITVQWLSKLSHDLVCIIAEAFWSCQNNHTI